MPRNRAKHPKRRNIGGPLTITDINAGIEETAAGLAACYGSLDIARQRWEAARDQLLNMGNYPGYLHCEFFWIFEGPPELRYENQEWFAGDYSSWLDLDQKEHNEADLYARREQWLRDNISA